MRNPQSSATSNKKSAATKKTTAVSTTTSKPTPCCSKVGLKRGPWTPEEDELLVSYLAKEGEGRWRTLPKRAGLLRCGKSCRLRWMNYLRPSVKRGPISSDEEDLILRLHRLLGNRWSLIAGRIPGRTDNEIKNYWNTHLSKKLISQGIDPRTHKPLKPESSTVSDAKASSSSSKVNHNPNTNKPSPISSGLDQDTTSSDCQNQKEETHTGYLHPTNNVLEGLCQDSTILLPHGYAAANNFPCFEALTFRGYEDDLDACGDDIFSSFLNSLINEESAASQQQEKVFNGAMPGSHFDPLLLISGSNYGGIGTSCKDTPAVMSSTFYHQDEHSNLRSSNDHI